MPKKTPSFNHEEVPSNVESLMKTSLTISNTEIKKKPPENRNDIEYEKEMTIGIPQMCLEGLSENWIFRELGNVHNDLMYKGLDTRSGDLCDSKENRIYTSFTRIIVKSKISLNDFNENEKITLKGRIKRSDNSMCISKFTFRSKDDQQKVFEAEMVSVFSISPVEGGKKLQKKEMANGVHTPPRLKGIPGFGHEYRLIKMQQLKSLMSNGQVFTMSGCCIFETKYTINPYYEGDREGRLNFASYPTINDSCEALYFNQQRLKVLGWQQSYFTASRDVMYYGHCEMSDTIIYKLHHKEILADQSIKLSSSLIRESDNTVMAHIFTIKKPK